jgi:hypothetical protein
MPDGTTGLGHKAAVPPGKPPFGPVQAYHVEPIPGAGAQTQPSPWMMAETFQPLNADRYVAVGYPNRSKGETGDAGKLAYPVLDLVAGKVTLPEVAPGPDIPGTPNLIYYDAPKGDAGLFSGYGSGAKAYRYAHWDLAAGKVDWTVPVADIDAHTAVQPIGVDPQGQYFYFLKETNENQALSQQVHADKATIGRVDLKTRQIDWTHAVPLPGRSGSLDGAIDVKASPDFRKFVITEHTEYAPAAGAPPAQGFVVDVGSDSHTALTIPRTPYGITFDRENHYLAIASNADAKIYRYDLATNTQDVVVGTVGRVHTLALSSDNKQLYVFTKGRTMELRDWPSLKPVKTLAAGTVIAGQTHFNGEGMAVLPDGKHAVMTKTEAPYGFPDEDDFFSVGMGPAKQP